MSQPFHIKEQSQDGLRVLALSGELDLATAPQLGERLIGNVDTVLDLSELSFIDSTGVRLLVKTAQRAQRDGWHLEIRRPQGAVQSLIELVGIEGLLGLEGRSRSADVTES